MPADGGDRAVSAELEESCRENGLIPSTSSDPGHGHDRLANLSELSESELGGSKVAASVFSRRTGGGVKSLPAPFAAVVYPLLRLGDGDAQTRTEATLNLLNNLLGAGILAMPQAFAHAGLITGLALMGVIALANRYTLLMVLQLSETHLEESSYPEIGRHVFGQRGLLAVLATYLLFTGGILSAYVIAITDIFRQAEALQWMPRFVLVAMATLVVMPGAMLRSLRQVALLSAICMVGVCVLAVVLIAVCVGDALSPRLVNAPIEDPSRAGDVDLFRGDPRRLLAGAALFALQFSVQAGGIEVLSRIAPDAGEDEAQGRSVGLRNRGDSCDSASEERSPTSDEVDHADQPWEDSDARGGADTNTGGGRVPHGPRTSGHASHTHQTSAFARSNGHSHSPMLGTQSSSLVAADGVSQVAFLAAFAVSAVIGVAGYLRFGDRVRGDVLLSFSERPSAESSPALAVARLAYGFVVVTSFAFVMVPCRCAALDVFALRRRDHTSQHADMSNSTGDKLYRVNACILCVCAGVAWLVSDLAELLEFVGIWATMALAFILPCAFLVELRRRQEGLPLVSKRNALPLGLMGFGAAVAAMSVLEVVASWLPGVPVPVPAHVAIVAGIEDAKDKPPMHGDSPQEDPVCADTPGWASPRGFRCVGPVSYESEGWCAGGHATGDGFAMLGGLFGHPELNCCACGKLDHASVRASNVFEAMATAGG